MIRGCVTCVNVNREHMDAWVVLFARVVKFRQLGIQVSGLNPGFAGLK